LSQIFLFLNKKYLTPEKTKSGFLIINFSKSLSELIVVIETLLYLLDKIFNIFFSSKIIPTFA